MDKPNYIKVDRPVHSNVEWDEIIKWIYDNIGNVSPVENGYPLWQGYSSEGFMFLHQKDAVLFIMKWC